MLATLQGKKVVIVIAPEEFRDEEFAQPHAALNLAGADVTVASVEEGKCYGSRGSVVHATMSLAEASTKQWDAVVFVGGAGGQIYVNDLTAHILARQAVENGAVLAAICMAPAILAHAGILKGLEATAFVDRADELRRYGAIYKEYPVVEAKNQVNGAPVITGNGPEAAFAFGQTVVNALRGPMDFLADFNNISVK